jgi:hypothetical protein
MPNNAPDIIFNPDACSDCPGNLRSHQNHPLLHSLYQHQRSVGNTPQDISIIIDNLQQATCWDAPHCPGLPLPWTHCPS